MLLCMKILPFTSQTQYVIINNSDKSQQCGVRMAMYRPQASQDPATRQFQTIDSIARLVG